MNKKEYRRKLFTDLYTNIVPERIPIQDCFGYEYQVQAAGYDLLKFQCTCTEQDIENVLENTMKFAMGDIVGIGSPRDATGMMLQKNNENQMSESGFIQHPERSVMNEDEYDEFIKNPHEFIYGTCIPRKLGIYSEKDPVKIAMAFARFLLSSNDSTAKIGKASKKINEKYELYSPPPGTVGSQPVPFDNIADLYRGFSGITLDIKRCPQKVLDACEAMMPYAIWKGSQSKADPLGYNGIATHMAPFLRTKEFEKFYWPTFSKLIHIQAARGQQTAMFCENDWTRFAADYLQDLPMGTRLCFEFGDAKQLKDKLGKKMILGGLYPISLLKSGTKEQCVDKAKEIIDIMGCGGNFYFRFDKPTLHKEDVDAENYKAVMDYVLNQKYDNAGEKVSDTVKAYTIQAYNPDEYPAFKSKYIESYESFTEGYDGFPECAQSMLKEKFDLYNSKIIRFFS